MFFLKKLLSAFLAPLTLALGALCLGLMLRARVRTRRLGTALAIAGGCALLLGGLDITANLVLAPLEGRFPPLLVPGTPGARDADARRARYVVVLGSGNSSARGWPALTQLDVTGIARLTEGIRLMRAIPGARLVLTGGLVGGDLPYAEVAARAAQELGVPRQSIVVDDRPRDTEEEARVLVERVGSEPFVLVTSASHLPRAVGLLRKRGLDPIPAPADVRSRERPGPDLDDFFPSGANWSKLDRAWHEILGSLWSRLRGKI